MVALVLGLLLTVAPHTAPAQQDSCVNLLPAETRSGLSVGSLTDAEQVWTNEPPVSRDSLRAFLTQLTEARACFQTQSSNPSEHVIRTYYWASFYHAALRDFPEAFEALSSALQSVKQHADQLGDDQRTKLRVGLHQDLGYLHFLLGNLSASVQQYLRAYQATPEENVEQRAENLLGVGILHLRMEDRSSARHYFDRVQTLVDTSDLTSEVRRKLRARTYHNQADLLVGLLGTRKFSDDNLKRAQTLAQKARRLSEPGTEEHARISVLLSEILGYLGEFDQAFRLNEEAHRYARSASDVRLRTFSLLKLGVLHIQAEHWTRADTVLNVALRRAENMGALDYQRRILRSMGRLYELQGRWSDAERYYRKGTHAVEKYRESLTASQWSMTAFAQWRDVYRGLVRSLLAQNQHRAALHVLDQSRARHLQDLRTQARIANDLPPADRTRLDSLSRALVDVRNRLGNNALSNGEDAALRDREADLIASRQQLLQIDSVASRPSVDALADAMADENRALVSYFLDDPWPVYGRTPRSAAFVLTGDTLHTVPLPNLTQDSVRSSVTAISPLFTSTGKPAHPNAMHFDLRPLHKLHDTLYEPVDRLLPSNRSLTVIPDGPLFHLPFSMLVDSMPGGRFAPGEARFVLHDRPTSVELASSLVADTAHSTHEWSQFEPQMAAYGVSEFDTLTTVPAALRAAIPEALSGSTLGLPPLPGVEKELRSVRSRFPKARVALNDAATEAEFCRSVRTAGVLHVASHAFVNPTSPLRNAILLRKGRGSESSAAAPEEDGPTRAASDSTTENGSDGVLFLHELQGLRSRIPMVVLSGCNTARGTLRGGEGMEGLQYAFRAMGAQSTVSTLWPVADEANAELMDAFYANLQEDAPKDEALRQAQLQFLRQNPDLSSPFFWAPPVLYGSSAPLPLDKRFLPVWAWWGLGLLGVALLAGLLVWVRSPGRPHSIRSTKY